MPLERTLSIIKPDAVSTHLSGSIISRFEQAGFTILSLKMLKLTKIQAEGFYAEHREKVFFDELIKYMISGPVIVLVLQAKDAIKNYRDIIGKTDPEEASFGTIRSDFAESKQHNAVHGSDSPEAASREIAFFFADDEICAPVAPNEIK